MNNSGEDAATTHVSSEVDERQSMGTLASLILMQKREASAALARIYHSAGESSLSGPSHIRSAGRPVAMHLHKKEIEQRPKMRTGDSASERIRTEHQEVRDHLQLRADEAYEITS